MSAYAIDDGARLVLIDPIAVPDDVRALFGSREVVTVLTSTLHERDAAALGFPVWAPAPDRPEDQLVPATRYAIGDMLFGMEAYPGREGELDLVLWSGRIRAVIAGDTLPRKKPDPEPLLHACRGFGIVPGDMLMIGDSANDVEAARSAGCPVFCVDYGYNEGQDVRELDVDAIVASLIEATRLIQKA